ncbi:hypothetical protein [Bacillus thuringiensis]|nr:hypothetical protein [Bacillus thuringiensis]
MKKASALFINEIKNALRLDVIDYDVNQAFCKVDDMYTKEKTIWIK